MNLLVLLAQAGFDLLGFVPLLARSHAALLAEIIALRTQSRICATCHHPRRRLTDASKIIVASLDRVFDLRHQLPLLTPRTVRSWAALLSHRAFWLRARRRGRPPLCENTVAIIRRIAGENPTWKIREIARKLTAYLGLRISAATVRKYLPPGDPRRRRRHRRESSECWSALIHNHVNALLACDFAVERTLWGGVLYVLVIMEIGSRRILHANVTAHPTAEWTIQQFRECIATDHPFRFLIHDRDSIFSAAVDATLRSFGIEPLRSPFRSPRANAFCERLIGTMRRECLNFLVPFGEAHLRPLVREWVTHYNRARPHTSLGGNVPEPNEHVPAPLLPSRHRLPGGAHIVSMPILGGLSHEYRFDHAA